MRFEGRVYFDFASADTWNLYRFFAAAAAAGAELAMEWVPFLAGDDPARGDALAGYQAVRERSPDRSGAYLQALLTHHHLDGAPLDEPATLAAAAGYASIDPGLVLDPSAARSEVRRISAEAAELGVTGTPTIVRHGPAMRVRINPAALRGDVVARLGTIDAVLADDGLWVLEKP